MLGMWHVGDVGCLCSEIFGTLDVRDVEYSGCGMCDVRDVGYLGCGMFTIWDVRDMGCLGCGVFRIWDFRNVGDVRDVECLGCGMFDGMWDVDLQNAALGYSSLYIDRCIFDVMMLL